jgi:hypothetical protein
MSGSGVLDIAKNTRFSEMKIQIIARVGKLTF